MSFKVVIPSRFQSTRLPGKPLLDIVGKPMVQHVFEAASKSNAGEVIVATDDERIAQACESFGAKVCMTSDQHISGTDRLEEVSRKLGWGNNEIVVNVQGDEPLIEPSLINQVAENLAENSWASIASLCEVLTNAESILNPNNVKVVFSKSGQALYFSRAPIPWLRNGMDVEVSDEALSLCLNKSQLGQCQYFRHIGIYAYRSDFLREFVSWPAAAMELSESLEQLRALENDRHIHMAQACDAPAPGVDTQEDLEVVRKIFISKMSQ